MRAARRADLIALGLVDRRFGYPLEMVLRAAAGGLAHRGGGGGLPAAQGSLEGDRDHTRNGESGEGHASRSGALNEYQVWPLAAPTANASVKRRRFRLLVLAKSPVAGRVKTRLCPPFLAAEAAELAAAAIADTLAGGLRCRAQLARRRGYSVGARPGAGWQSGRLASQLLQQDVEGPLRHARGCPTRR